MCIFFYTKTQKMLVQEQINVVYQFIVKTDKYRDTPHTSYDVCLCRTLMPFWALLLYKAIPHLLFVEVNILEKTTFFHSF